MSRHFPSDFEIPLVLSVATTDPAGGGRQQHRLEYIVRPTRCPKQPRLEGRLVFEPRIDLGRYECKAAIDWIWIEMKTGRTTQSRHLHDQLKQVLGREIFVTGPDKDHDVKRTFNHTGDRFRLKLHDPEPADLRAILDDVGHRHGVVGEAKVLGIEIAIDFYPARKVPDAEVDADRHRMVAVLQRHHLADWDLFSGPNDDMRQTFTSMLEKKDNETRFVIPDPTRPLSDRRTLSDCDVDDDRVQARHFELEDAEDLLIDATTYRGAKGGPVSYRVQDKVRDGSAQDAQRRVLLPLRERRARVEVTLLEAGVRTVGIDTVDDLIGFNFVGLRKKLFPTYLPTVPGVRRSVEDVRQVADKARLNSFRRAFIRGGCYALVLNEKARRKWRVKSVKRQRRNHSGLPARRRFRIGKKDHLVEWRRMNARTGAALGRLSTRWSSRRSR